MSELLKKLKAAGSVKGAEVLAKSAYFNKKDHIPTRLPILNIAFSGSLDGGLTPGLTILAGESKSFKTLLGLYCMRAYLDMYKDAIAILYDSEFGVTPEYLASNGIDAERVLHVPIEHIEQLKFDVVKRLEEIKRGDKVFIMVDSLGNLASKKETEDALDEKSVADMSRAKAIRSLMRIITPHLTMKDLPCVVINHIYNCGTEDMFAMTPDGPKSLKDFVVGDLVLTTAGYEAVSYITSHTDAWVTEIDLEDGSTLSFTGGHRFMVDGTWMTVDELEVGMDLDVKPD